VIDRGGEAAEAKKKIGRPLKNRLRETKKPKRALSKSSRSR